jgi:hypothetical protein
MMVMVIKQGNNNKYKMLHAGITKYNSLLREKNRIYQKTVCSGK